MKAIKIVIGAMLFFMTTGITAQVTVNVGPGTTPVWAREAPPKTQYYYLPDIETYYDVPAKRYIYFRNGVWTRSTSLPYRYRTYNLSKGRTVYLTDYKGKTPYVFYKQHKVKYVGKKWKANGHDNGNHYGNYKGNNGKGKVFVNSNGNGNGNHGNENHGKGNGKGKK